MQFRTFRKVIRELLATHGSLNWRDIAAIYEGATGKTVTRAMTAQPVKAPRSPRRTPGTTTGKGRRLTRSQALDAIARHIASAPRANGTYFTADEARAEAARRIGATRDIALDEAA